MIIHKNFIFAHCPRTGGTFIENYLHSNIPGCQTSVEFQGIAKHHPVSDIPLWLDVGGNMVEKFAFGVVRNPFDYYVSVWHFENREHRKTADGNAYVMDGVRHDFRAFVRRLMRLDKNPGKDLWDFESMRKLDVGLATWRFLYCFCSSYDIKAWNLKDILMLDWVLRFEQLKFDLYAMLKKKQEFFNITQPQLDNLLFHQKVNVSPDRRHWHMYYDDETKALVEEKDKFLFDNFYRIQEDT